MKKTYIFIGLVILLMLVGISLEFPCFFSKELLASDPKSSLTVNDWTGFMGSYAGGIIGGLLGSAATIFGVYLTMSMQYKQTQEERRLSVRPALYFQNLEQNEEDGVNGGLVYDIDVSETDDVKTETCEFRFKTYNIGPGIILKIILKIPEVSKENGMGGAEYSLTKCGETRYWKYYFNVTCDADNRLFNYPLTLKLYYSDVFGNVYEQIANACILRSTEQNEEKIENSKIIVQLFGEKTEPRLMKKMPKFMKGWQD